MSLNIHYLELFYYVAKHQGISEAVRNIPYGIQQPAVSAQILALEDDLGVKLFQRRPFVLTPVGEKLFRFVQPFFAGLDGVENELRSESQQIRLGGSGIFLRDHLPAILHNVRARFPRLKINLREAHQPQLETWLTNGELDLAVTLLQTRPPPGIHAQPLLELPLILLVEKGSPLKSAAELWTRDKIEEALICVPAQEAIPKRFREGLEKHGADWLPRIEVSSLALIEIYVTHGYGIGLYVDIPGYKFLPGIRVLRLDDFPRVELGAIWPGKKTPLIQTFLEETKRRVEAVTGNRGG